MLSQFVPSVARSIAVVTLCPIPPPHWVNRTQPSLHRIVHTLVSTTLVRTLFCNMIHSTVWCWLCGGEKDDDHTNVHSHTRPCRIVSINRNQVFTSLYHSAHCILTLLICSCVCHSHVHAVQAVPTRSKIWILMGRGEGEVVGSCNSAHTPIHTHTHIVIDDQDDEISIRNERSVHHSSVV